MEIIKFRILRRNVVALLAFFGFINIYVLRVNLSVAIVDMTAEHKIEHENGTISYVKYFDWDSIQRGNILSAFFYGYISTQLIGGWLGNKFGGVTILGSGIASTALLTLLTPYMARISANALIALRIVEGILEGVTFPCMHAVWCKWAPPDEKTKLATFVYAGSYAGLVIGFQTCGLITDLLGWQYAFYIPGIVGLLWYILWLTYVTNNPEDDRYITEAELKYIKDATGHSDAKVSYPWKKIFTSMPVWAIVVIHCCENWGFYTLMTQLPTYLSGKFKLDITNAGLLSALPYALRLLTAISAGFIVDVLRRKKILTTTQARKAFTAGGLINEIIFMIITGYTNVSWIAVLCLTLSCGLGGVLATGYLVNPLDLAPQYASIILGISNTFATLSGIIAPNVAGHVVVNGTESEWRVIFLLTAAIYAFGVIFYTVFGSGEKQSWAEKNKVSENLHTFAMQRNYS